MKTLIKLALDAVILCSTFAAQAEWVSGYSRANNTMTDNLNYRGYGTVRVPRSTLGR